jgi:hypothetical protein
MNNHSRIYLKYFDLTESDVWQCEACTKEDHIQNLVIHHIHGRGPGKDVICNLMCLCTRHHGFAHGSKEYVSKDDF